MLVKGRQAVNLISPVGGRLTMYCLITTAQCNAEVKRLQRVSDINKSGGGNLQCQREKAAQQSAAE